MADEASTVRADAAPSAGEDAGVGRRFRVRLPASFLMVSAAGLSAAWLASPEIGVCGVVRTLGIAVGGGLALAVCLALAEMRSTAPFRGGAWHFVRMLYGVRGGVLMAWFEVFALVATASMLAGAAGFLAGAASLAMQDIPAGALAGSVLGALALGLAMSGPILLRISLSPQSPRPAERAWRRVFKWISFGVFTIAWGVVLRTGWNVLTTRATFSATTSPQSLLPEFIAGFLSVLAGFLAVVHGVPEDIPRQTAGADPGFLEHRRYRLPRGMILGLLGTFLTAVGTGLAVSVIGLDEAGRTAIFLQRTVLQGTAAVAALGGAFYALVAAVRVLSALIREGMLPAWLAFTGAGDPSRAASRRPFSSALGTALLLLAAVAAAGGRNWSGTIWLAGLLHSLLGAATCFCQLRLRREIGDEVDYGFVLPGFPWLPRAAGIALLIAALGFATLYPPGVGIVLVALGSGWFLYEGYARTHSLQRADDDIQDFLAQSNIPQEDQEQRPTRNTIRVFAAADDSALAVSLLQLGRHLCGRRPFRLSVLHLLTAPDRARLSDAARNVSQAVEFVKEVTTHFASSGIPLHASVRCSHSAARGILTTARESGTDLILLGWHGRIQRGQPAAWGKTLDPVLRRAPCPVIVAKGIGVEQRYHKILVPVLDAVHSLFALKIASRLAAADNDETEIELFRVHTSGVDELNVREFLRRNASQLVVWPSLRITCRSEVCGSEVDGVLEEALRGQHDLIVLGTTPPEQADTEESSVSTKIAVRTKVPCLMVTTAASGIGLWFGRRFRQNPF